MSKRSSARARLEFAHELENAVNDAIDTITLNFVEPLEDALRRGAPLEDDDVIIASELLSLAEHKSLRLLDSRLSVWITALARLAKAESPAQNEDEEHA